MYSTKLTVLLVERECISYSSKMDIKYPDESDLNQFKFH